LGAEKRGIFWLQRQCQLSQDNAATGEKKLVRYCSCSPHQITRALIMKKWLCTTHTRWEIFMFVALAITLLGSIPFFVPSATDGRMGGLGVGLFFSIWVFGVFGLFVLFMENAAGKKLFAILGIGCSILLLAWGLIIYKCPENELCLEDINGNGWLLTICLVVLASLLAYDKTKEKIPPLGKCLIKVFARSMVVVWACALLFFVATVNKPLPLRIDRTAHPVTQEVEH
jgi:hypothetical protein